MKRYLTVFLALCLLLMTNVCFAEIIAHDYAAKVEIKSNPTNYGNRWKYLCSYWPSIVMNPTVNEVYFDRASVQYTTIRGKRVLEFTLWKDTFVKDGDSSFMHYGNPAPLPCIVDLENCILYKGVGRDTGYKFPPEEVITSDSALYYSYYDHNKERFVPTYPWLTPQQMKDYFLVVEYEYTVKPNKGELPDLSKGHGLGLKYSPNTYEFIGYADVGESALYPNTFWKGFSLGEDNCQQALHNIITQLIPEALQIANP